MNTRERILSIRLIEKMNKDPQFSKKLALKKKMEKNTGKINKQTNLSN